VLRLERVGNGDEPLSDRRIGLLVLAIVAVFALGLGVALAWHSHLSSLASTA